LADNAELTVRDVMRREVPVAAPTTTIAELARMMVEHRVPGVPIVSEGELVGIVTEADLIQREARVDAPSILPFLDAVFVADAGTPFEEELRRVVATTAEEMMTAPVISIRDIATVSELATLMLQRRINPVPVVDENRQIVGLGTRTGIVELIARLESTARGSGVESASG
jgi:CBS domain-containing protein